jgi:hypothetical protein
VAVPDPPGASHRQLRDRSGSSKLLVFSTRSRGGRGRAVQLVIGRALQDGELDVREALWKGDRQAKEMSAQA